MCQPDKATISSSESLNSRLKSLTSSAFHSLGSWGAFVLMFEVGFWFGFEFEFVFEFRPLIPFIALWIVSCIICCKAASCSFENSGGGWLLDEPAADPVGVLAGILLDSKLDPCWTSLLMLVCWVWGSSPTETSELCCGIEAIGSGECNSWSRVLNLNRSFLKLEWSRAQ